MNNFIKQTKNVFSKIESKTKEIKDQIQTKLKEKNEHHSPLKELNIDKLIKNEQDRLLVRVLESLYKTNIAVNEKDETIMKEELMIYQLSE